jgi:hypothetical protein
MDIDRALARALEADDPGPQFAGKIVAAITAGQAAPAAVPMRPKAASVRWRMVLPLAATIALVTAGAEYRARQAAEAERAREAQVQLVQALRLAGAQLNVVHRAIERSQE